MPGETKGKDDGSYKEKCKTLKRKLRFLVHEQECFQEELRKAQRKLLKVSRDKNFLLDRLLQYERVIFSGSDSEPTDSSDDERPESRRSSQDVPIPKPKVKRKPRKKPAKKLEADSKLGPGKTVLPIKVQSPPSSLKQHMPQLVEMLNRASTATVGAVSPDAFAGLPYTPAYGLSHFPTPGHLSQVFDQVPPSTTASVLPSLLMSPHFPRLNLMRNLPPEPAHQPTPRKKVRRDSGKPQTSTPKANKTGETQPPAAAPKSSKAQDPTDSNNSSQQMELPKTAHLSSDPHPSLPSTYEG